MTKEAHWKTTGPYQNSSLWPFSETQWNETDSFIYWDFCILVTTEMSMMRHKNYDRMWKMRIIFYKLTDVYAKYYSRTEHLTVSEIIVLFKGKIIFKHYITKEHRWFWIKTYKLWDWKGHTYNMSVYLHRDRKCSTATKTATCAAVSGLTTGTENLGHKLYMNDFFLFWFLLWFTY
jgi:hypothetical protein